MAEKKPKKDPNSMNMFIPPNQYTPMRKSWLWLADKVVEPDDKGQRDKVASKLFQYICKAGIKDRVETMKLLWEIKKIAFRIGEEVDFEDLEEK